MSSSNRGGGFSSSRPLGRSGKSEPPNLADYPDEPQYDLATIVQLVGVRPMTLWAWEQQLNIPKPPRTSDGGSGTPRHYSERDLIAAMWLRDQILAGHTPGEAAERLLAAQRSHGTAPGAGGADPASQEPLTPRVPTTSRPLRQQAPFPPGESSGAAASGLLAPESPPGASGVARQTSSPSWGEAPAQPWAPRQGSMSRPLAPSSTSGPLTPPYTARTGVPSGPLRTSAVSGPLRGSATSGVGWQASPTTPARDLRSFVPQLIRAFVTFDTFTANRVVEEALALRSVETTCVGLLLPALQRVGEMWSKRELSIPEERFAVNYVRGRLFSIFTNAVERFDGPLVIVACGPRELHDIGALTLALFWRRAGMKVIFLGQDVEGHALTDDARMRHPRLVCVSIMSTQRLRALARISKDIGHIEAPKPIFAYSGAIFAQNPELRRRVSGVYLGDDPASATWQAMRLLGMDFAGIPAGNPPQGPIGQVS
jgi:methanogenic corrinoid protein MtbC1